MSQVDQVRPQVFPQPLDLPPNESQHTEAQIDFFTYIRPFTEPLERYTNQIVSIPARLWSNVLSVTEIIYRIFAAIQGVLFRLVFDPEFEPESEEFRKILHNYDQLEPELSKKLNSLNRTFVISHISDDINALKELQFEINKSYQQLEYYIKTIETNREEPLPIHAYVRTLVDKYAILVEGLKKYYVDHGYRILELFQQALNVLKDETFPDSYKQEMAKTWNELHSAFQKFLPKEKEKEHFSLLETRVHSLLNEQRGDPVSPILKPLPFKNIENSCYIAASLQALLSSEEVVQEICLPLPNPEKCPQKVAVQKEIMYFIDSQRGKKCEKGLPLMKYIQTLIERPSPSIRNLRAALFNLKSLDGSRHDLTQANLTRQNDAMTIFELITKKFLTACECEIQSFARTPLCPGRVFSYQKEPLFILSIGIGGKADPQTGMKWQRAANLITLELCENATYEKKPWRKFTPANGVVVNQSEADEADLRVDKNTEISGPKYFTSLRLTKLPKVMVIQFKRFSGNAYTSKKITDPVVLPKDGIIDFAPYYVAPKDGSPSVVQTKYQVLASVVHTMGNSLTSGHFVCYVIKNGEYYLCDDLKPGSFTKISKECFYENDQSYILVLERLGTSKT